MRPGPPLLGALALLACGEPAPAREPPMPRDAVAVVDGRPVTKDAVARLAREAGITPKEALERLVRVTLLAGYAEARGYGTQSAVTLGVQQAGVRALLAVEIEAQVPAEDVAGRARRLDALLAQLAAKTRVRLDEQGLAHALGEAAPP